MTSPDQGVPLMGMRILLVVASTTGGTGAHVGMLVDHLLARGGSVVVCGPQSVDAQFGFRTLGAGFVQARVGLRPHPRDGSTLRRLRRLAVSADVVHAHSLRAATLAGMATPKRVPFVVTRHNAIISTGAARRLQAALQRYAARRADVTLCVSGDLVDAVRRAGGTDVRRAFVTAPTMPKPIRTREAVRAELGAGDRPVVLAIGRLHSQKDYPTLIAAACRLRDMDPTPMVAIAGDGPERAELAALIARTSAPVRLLGDRSDVADLLHAADVQAMSSVWEGTPLSVQEGLSAGLPFVGTRVGSIPDIIADAGLLVPPHDVRALVVQLRRVLTDTDLAADLRRRALRRAVALPSEADVTEQVVAAYIRASETVRTRSDAP